MLASRAAEDVRREALRTLLSALATETVELARSADGLQDLFGRLMERGTQASGVALEQAQALDGLAQRLDGLQTFLAGLAASPLDDLEAETAEIAGHLRLTSQARRFGRPGARPREALGGGDCDLF